jgi:hypothetical protein
MYFVKEKFPKLTTKMQVSFVNEAPSLVFRQSFIFLTGFCMVKPGASFTKLTYVSDLSFTNFLLPNAHNFVI